MGNRPLSGGKSCQNVNDGIENDGECERPKKLPSDILTDDEIDYIQVNWTSTLHFQSSKRFISAISAKKKSENCKKERPLQKKALKSTG